MKARTGGAHTPTNHPPPVPPRTSNPRSPQSQGATITGKVIIDVQKAFTAGQLYVLLSRITTRANLRIVGNNLPMAWCKPVDIEAIRIKAGMSANPHRGRAPVPQP